MSISFESRVVVVTGAGGALGRVYAREFARRGAAVVVNDLGGTARGTGSAPDAADAVVAEIRAAGGKAVASYDTVATREGSQRVIEAALHSFGRIDVVINNAGNIRSDWFGDVTEADLRSQIDTHLMGSFFATQAAWPAMVAQKYGRILFTTSAAGMLGNRGQTGYGAAKGGITGLMNVVSLEGRRLGILCNAIQPNAHNRMGEDMARVMDGEAIDRFSIVPGLGASMTADFTVPLAVYLASEACQSSHAVFSSLGGRFARVFTGITAGWQGDRDTPATAEEVAEHFDDIGDTSRGFVVPDDLINEYELLLAQPAGQAGRP
ncbi:SDR family NAD(P)-dependent oxidoreductase [Sphingomonas solaris]|uniref:SDR family NAD(P)-dependent oxidoreductase n=1 Tax=Alterirhizorhabdus solaris TaxID=2529389 RepID=A0A558R8W2_9SPHN|nr:SDR family NAD(P)-dependent oxidoreductase [Sphingomonas solaris]TVV75839.1 SDR family NAD(P)-dependent oxidoreductase [Sphingomonas solaris]